MKIFVGNNINIILYSYLSSHMLCLNEKSVEAARVFTVTKPRNVVRLALTASLATVKVETIFTNFYVTRPKIVVRLTIIAFIFIIKVETISTKYL